MSLICPTVLANSRDEFREQIETITPFAERIQIDVADGDFATQTVGLSDVSWPDTVSADIHLMYAHPERVLPQLIALQPALVIVHAEATGDVPGMLAHLKAHGIETGVALLQATTVESARSLIELVDHVLIFSGSLGQFGGRADLSLLAKVASIRAIRPNVEIGWDGGINVDNAGQLARGGIDVLNVGGAIQKASRPENAYRDLVRRITT